MHIRQPTSAAVGALATRGEATADTNGRDSGDPARRVGRAGSLPNGRAVVGGFLVALAAIGVFVAYRGTTNGPAHHYVVVNRDLAAGTTIAATDLALSGVDLPDATAPRAFSDPAALVGRVTVAPIAKGELVQASAVAERSSATTGFQVSIPLERARALDGALQAGELVDVLVTYAGSSTARTLVVARRAQVVRVDSANRSAISTSTELVLVLGVVSEDEALAITHGSQAGKITLVRATGADANQPAGTDSYQPPADGG